MHRICIILLRGEGVEKRSEAKRGRGKRKKNKKYKVANYYRTPPIYIKKCFLC